MLLWGEHLLARKGCCVHPRTSGQRLAPRDFLLPPLLSFLALACPPLRRPGLWGPVGQRGRTGLSWGARPTASVPPLASAPGVLLLSELPVPVPWLPCHPLCPNRVPVPLVTARILWLETSSDLNKTACVGRVWWPRTCQSGAWMGQDTGVFSFGASAQGGPRRAMCGPSEKRECSVSGGASGGPPASSAPLATPSCVPGTCHHTRSSHVPARNLSVLLIFSQNPLLTLLIFSIVCFLFP